MKDLYKILNINKDASQKDIKTAYKKLAIINHPDKGGSEDTFKEISESYSILSDTNKRQMYDLGGYDSVSGNQSMNSPFEMFNNFFDGSPNVFSSHIFESTFFNETTEGNLDKIDKIVVLDITIHDLYNDSKKSIDVCTNIKCDKCNGLGHKPNGAIQCIKCGGSKQVKTKKLYGPFVQEVNVPCEYCHQTGFIIKDGYGCHKCCNTGLISNNKKYNLNITKGSDQREIKVDGMGNYNKDTNRRSNLIIKINELPNDRFIHRDRDIYIDEDIHLWDSILGCDHIIKYIDEDIIINIDKIIDPNILMIVKGYGMPEYNNLKHGDLIIKFNIIYPSTIPNIESIKKLVDHPQYDHKGIEINHHNHINTYTNVNESDTINQPQCVQQ